MNEIFFEVALDIAARWSISNSKLKEPVACGRKAIQIRRSRAWVAFSEIARGKARHATKKGWEMDLIKFWINLSADAQMFFAVRVMPLQGSL